MEMYTFYWENGTVTRQVGEDIIDAIKHVKKPWYKVITSIFAFSKGDKLTYRREGGNWRLIPY